MAGRYTGTLPAYSIMRAGTGLPPRFELGTEEYKRKRKELLEAEYLKEQEALRSKPSYGARGANPELVREANRRNLLTLTTNKHPAPMDARSIDALKKSRLAQIQQNEINKYRNALANSNTIAMGQVAPAAMSGAAQPPEKKRDPWLSANDAKMLIALMGPYLDPNQMPEPPTPYGLGVGGGNRAFSMLPFTGLMGGYS